MAKLMFISSAGGHLTELLKMKKYFPDYDSVLVTEKNKITKNLDVGIKVEFLIYGSRYYPLPYFFICILNFFKSLYLFFKYKPDLIYTTGAHTCVIMCYLAKIFHKKIIFVEVFDRITKPTLTGKMIYPIADLFFVQHEELLAVYPNAKYVRGVYS